MRIVSRLTLYMYAHAREMSTYVRGHLCACAGNERIRSTAGKTANWPGRDLYTFSVRLPRVHQKPMASGKPKNASGKFTEAQRATLQTFYKKGMVGTAEIYMPQIRMASTETGLTFGQVKVNILQQ